MADQDPDAKLEQDAAAFRQSDQLQDEDGNDYRIEQQNEVGQNLKGSGAASPPTDTPPEAPAPGIDPAEVERIEDARSASDGDTSVYERDPTAAGSSSIAD